MHLVYMVYSIIKKVQAMKKSKKITKIQDEPVSLIPHTVDLIKIHKENLEKKHTTRIRKSSRFER